MIGRPFLHKAVLILPNGNNFTVRAENLTAENKFVGWECQLERKRLATTVLSCASI